MIADIRPIKISENGAFSTLETALHQRPKESRPRLGSTVRTRRLRLELLLGTAVVFMVFGPATSPFMPKYWSSDRTAGTAKSPAIASLSTMAITTGDEKPTEQKTSRSQTVGYQGIATTVEAALCRLPEFVAGRIPDDQRAYLQAVVALNADAKTLADSAENSFSHAELKRSLSDKTTRWRTEQQEALLKASGMNKWVFLVRGEHADGSLDLLFGSSVVNTVSGNGIIVPDGDPFMDEAALKIAVPANSISSKVMAVRSKVQRGQWVVATIRSATDEEEAAPEKAWKAKEKASRDAVKQKAESELQAALDAVDWEKALRDEMDKLKEGREGVTDQDVRKTAEFAIARRKQDIELRIMGNSYDPEKNRLSEESAKAHAEADRANKIPRFSYAESGGPVFIAMYPNVRGTPTYILDDLEVLGDPTGRNGANEAPSGIKDAGEEVGEDGVSVGDVRKEGLTITTRLFNGRKLTKDECNRVLARAVMTVKQGMATAKVEALLGAPTRKEKLEWTSPAPAGDAAGEKHEALAWTWLHDEQNTLSVAFEGGEVVNIFWKGEPLLKAR